MRFGRRVIGARAEGAACAASHLSRTSLDGCRILGRALHEGPSAFVIPNPWDVGSARIRQKLSSSFNSFPVISRGCSAYSQILTATFEGQ